MRAFGRAAILVALTLAATTCLGPRDPTPARSAPPTGTVVETVAEGLDTAWALAFAPDGRIFVTERPGRIRVIENGTLDPEPWATVGVVENSESGLMGIALHPSFPNPPHVFVYGTFGIGSVPEENRILRFREEAGRGVEDGIVFSGIPANVIHDGGRLKFGPDGKLWATTGDASNQALAQDDLSNGGKVLRLEPDGAIPLDNPNPLLPWFTKGHRNVQGLAWHPTTGLAYVTEHGPSSNDEINVLRAGRNYAWPLQGRQNSPLFEDPIRVYAPSTIAPAGATFFVDRTGRYPDWNGTFVFVTLKDRDLRVIHLDPSDSTKVTAEEILFDGEYGRMRDVLQGPDGHLYFTTSNHDGRGQPKDGDDHVYRLRFQ